MKTLHSKKSIVHSPNQEGAMNRENQAISDICLHATIVDLDNGRACPYSEIYGHQSSEPNCPSIDSPIHSYLIYWPIGLVTYMEIKARLDDIQLHHIEAALAAATKLKRFTPPKSIRRRLITIRANKTSQKGVQT